MLVRADTSMGKHPRLFGAGITTIHMHMQKDNTAAVETGQAHPQAPAAQSSS
jgi:hypothetical protein